MADARSNCERFWNQTIQKAKTILVSSHFQNSKKSGEEYDKLCLGLYVYISCSEHRRSEHVLNYYCYLLLLLSVLLNVLVAQYTRQELRNADMSVHVHLHVHAYIYLYRYFLLSMNDYS